MRENNILKKARKTGMELNWSTYRRLRNQVNDRIYYEKRRCQREEIQNNLGNPKTFWKAVKNVTGGKSNATRRKMNSIKTDDGVLITDKVIAQKFNHFFTTTVFQSD